MDNKEIFAKNLNRYMLLNDKDRNDISKDLGISYYTVTDWVNGKKYPRMDKVEVLANYFGVSKSDLIEENINSTVNIGEKIKSARLSKGMTQEELGKILGVQKSAVAKYENGRVVNIKFLTLKKIFEVLEIKPSELIFFEPLKDSNFEDLTTRMYTDEEFLSVVRGLSKLNPEQFASVKQIVNVLSKG